MIFRSPAYEDLSATFGRAGELPCTSGRIALPFPFVIAWDVSQKILTFACHTKVAQPLTEIFAEAAQHYGEEEFKRLRLHYFGGCFNYRPMRGSTKLSVHSWGVAVDLDPQRNQLKWGKDKASFAAPEYVPFWRIVEAHGAVSLGRTKNFDWMHFQFCL